MNHGSDLFERLAKIIELSTYPPLDYLIGDQRRTQLDAVIKINE
jgi:hypothetical protein